MGRSEAAEFTVMCMVYDGSGNILVQERLNPDWPGITFPGGHVERGEAFADAVTREVLDERLAQAASDARASRGELQSAFGALQTRLEQLLVQSRGEQTQALTAFRAELTGTAQQLAGVTRN